MPESEKQQFPPQQQPEPGYSSEMQPEPVYEKNNGVGCDKLKGKAALITGGDSGIGRAVAIAFAQEGADVAIVYLCEDKDAEETRKSIEKYGKRCVTFRGDIGDEKFCQEAVEKTVNQLGKLDVLVNNSGEQHPKTSLEEISAEQLERTFRTNIFGMFYMSKAALKHLKSDSCIINTTSVTAYIGNKALIDYSSTKGAIVAFTRSLALNLVDKGIRVNGVAPGPVWTPLIPSTFPGEKVSHFGENYPMKRAGQPVEIAQSYVFLASNDSSFMSGQVLHPNGGTIVNG